MNKRIIFKNDGGGVAVIVPADKSFLTIDEIANKDVPKGKSYLIIDASDLPQDREQRDQWDINDADLTEVSKGAEWDFGLATENGYAWAKHTTTPDLFRVYVNFKIVYEGDEVGFDAKILELKDELN